MKIIKYLKQGIFYLPNLINGRFGKTNNDLVDLKTGEGKIVEKNGKKMACYKNENGKIIKLLAICTHMRCVVSWDKENKNWLCPCHESRFDVEGKVLEGPAKRDLKRLK